MKKLVMTIGAMVLAFTLAACGPKTADMQSETTETVVHGEIAWSDSEDADAAAESAGQTGDFVIPNPLPIGDYEWSDPTFMAMDNVVEAFFDGGAISCAIRKGEGVPLEDLSADLNEYKFDWTKDCNGIKVTCHGYEKDIANFLEWENGGCSYDVWCMSTGGDNLGMSDDEVYAMVTGIK